MYIKRGQCLQVAVCMTCWIHDLHHVATLVSLLVLGLVKLNSQSCNLLLTNFDSVYIINVRTVFQWIQKANDFQCCAVTWTVINNYWTSDVYHNGGYSKVSYGRPNISPQILPYICFYYLIVLHEAPPTKWCTKHECAFLKRKVALIITASLSINPLHVTALHCRQLLAMLLQDFLILSQVFANHVKDVYEHLLCIASNRNESAAIGHKDASWDSFSKAL